MSGLRLSHLVPVDRTVAIFAIASVALALLVFVAERQTHTAEEQVLHTVEVRAAIRDVDDRLRAAESVQRSYLIAPQPEFLDDYRAARTLVGPALDKLTGLVRDLRQRERVGALRAVVTERIALLDANVDRVRAGVRDEAIRDLQSGNGKAVMARVMATSAELDTGEVQLLADRRATLQRQQTLEVGSASALVLLSGLLLVVAERRAQRARTSRDMLAASERRYRGVVSAMNEGVIVLDASGHIQEANAAAERILGVPRAVMEGRHAGDSSWQTIHEDGTPFAAVDHPSMRALRTGAVIRNVVMGVGRPDGTLAWILINAEPLRPTAELPPNGVLTTFSDVTVQIEQNAELRRTRTQLANVLDGSNDGFWDWHVPTGAVTYSPRFTAMLGYASDDFTPNVSSWENLIHPDDLPGVNAVLSAHLRGESDQYSTEHRLRHKGGDWIWVLDRGRVVERGPDGAPIRASGTHTDITERKLAEEATRVAQRDNERLIAELRDALQSVHTLSGLLPICMHCKKVRDDEGYWKRIDEYIAIHTDAAVTHGLCPECEAVHYPEIAADTGPR